MQANLMVVEDEPLITFELEQILSSLGHQIVCTAKSGDEAIQYHKKYAPDLILMDISLDGDINGIDAGRIISECGGTPIIFLTAYDSDELVNDALKANIYGYLIKPIDARVLAVAIKTAIHKSGSELLIKSKCDYLANAFDAIRANIAIINLNGEITHVNKSWNQFSCSNGSSITDWVGVNYIDACETSAKLKSDYAKSTLHGINGLIKGTHSDFYMEYPCDAPNEKRWFLMRINPIENLPEKHLLIMHIDITRRRSQEEELKLQADLDPLTGIPNRRKVDSFLEEEWRRCQRHKRPISIAVVDIDHFKFLNDTYGHQYGDDCLIRIAGLLQSFAGRSTDLAARFGGEEFVLIWVETSLEEAKSMATKILDKISELKIPNINSPTSSCVTASIGIAASCPDAEDKMDFHTLFSQADKNLYKAKESGRNQLAY